MPEVVESLLEISKALLDIFVYNLIWETCFSRRGVIDDLQRSLSNLFNSVMLFLLYAEPYLLTAVDFTP